MYRDALRIIVEDFMKRIDIDRIVWSIFGGKFTHKSKDFSPKSTLNNGVSENVHGVEAGESI